ncbi:MAG: ArsI/CadI family heavy metal resistance metalloenzyme [Alphaproteobacteria bacterium]
MKRFHVHVNVPDIEAAVRFYTTMFGSGPAVLKADYAKWSLDDPRVNFAVSLRHAAGTGVDHLGIELDSAEALNRQAATLRQAGSEVQEQRGARCCYATGDKAWVHDPAGVRWETFHTTGTIPVYGEDTLADTPTGGGRAACCPTGG